MVADDNPPPLTQEQLDHVQGDIWSKGFPKYYETYYFFAIKPNKAKLFAQSLRELTTQPTPLICSLKEVKNQRLDIQGRKERAAAEAKRLGTPEEHLPLLSIVNALIAFSRIGLDELQLGLKNDLQLDVVGQTDPAFDTGMARDDTLNLRDPDLRKWEPLFQSPKIHAMLKIAGCSKKEVERYLKHLQTILRHGEAIEDAYQDMSPDTDSRVDGWTRPYHRGKEHFGFEDGISQPLMGGIDDLEKWPTPNMNTDPSLLIVTKDTWRESSEKRPEWMHDGSFLVFRKLEQNVKGFDTLTDQWGKYRCESKAHMGAKLMGRWQSGAPIVKFPCKDKADPEKAKFMNDFSYANAICPVSAHIRKTNPRFRSDGNMSDPRAGRTKLIRSGIPYGPDFEGHETDRSTRGLLFACYQGHIEDSFLNMQASWSNRENFQSDGIGNDPIIGQALGGNLKTAITDTKGNHSGHVEFQQLVTLKGGEYFFAPSIKALRGILSEHSG